MKQSRSRGEYPLKIHAQETQPQKRGSQRALRFFFRFLWAQIYAWRARRRAFEFSSLSQSRPHRDK